MVTLPKHTAKYAVCRVPRRQGTRQTRRQQRVPVKPLYFAVCQIQLTANMALPAAVCHVLFAVCSTRQKVCRVPFRLCRVPKAHGKAKESGSELIIN